MLNSLQYHGFFTRKIVSKSSLPANPYIFKSAFYTSKPDKNQPQNTFPASKFTCLVLFYNYRWKVYFSRIFLLLN